MRNAIEGVLKKYNVQYLPALYSASIYETQDDSAALVLLCAEPDKINSFINTFTQIPDSGMLLPVKFMEERQLLENNTIVLYDSLLCPHTVNVSGSFRYYVGLVGVMSPDVYTQTFGKAPVYNSYYCQCDESDIAAIRQEVGKISPFTEIRGSEEFRKEFESSRQLCNLIAIILVSLSTIIIFVVLTNLTNILINHRMKELLVMKVNGFSKDQVYGYLLRETIVITVMGLVLGVGAGLAMHGIVIHTTELVALMYDRNISPMPWIISAGMNIVFSLVIIAISFRKVGKTHLTDIAKY